MQLLETPKQNHINFWNPQQKPVGPYEIDWGNSLTNELAFFLVPIGQRIVDLVTGKVMDNIEGTLSNYSIGATSNGEYLRSSGGSTEMHWMSIAEFDLQQFSYGFVGSFDNVAESDKRIFSFGRGSSSTPIVSVQQNTTQLGNYWRADDNSTCGSVSSAGYLANNEYHSVCTILNAQGNGSVRNSKNFSNGTKLTDFNTGNLGASTTIDRVAVFGLRRNNSASQCEGTFHAAYAFKRTLSEFEGRLLSLNPYALLKPTVPMLGVVSAAAAATSPKTLTLLGVG